MHENVKAHSVDHKGHEEANPETQIRGFQQPLTELVLVGIVPGGLRSLLLGIQKEAQPVGGILFRLSKGCLGTEQEDAGHENTQNIKAPAAQGTNDGTTGRAIMARVCVRVKDVGNLSMSNKRKPCEQPENRHSEKKNSLLRVVMLSTLYKHLPQKQSKDTG
jgi:hypothetical protein